MGGAKLGPDAYKKLYPAEFYKQFIDNGIRPDGRSFGVGRPVTIGLNPIEAPASSALVKIGNTSVLAGCTFEVWILSYLESEFAFRLSDRFNSI